MTLAVGADLRSAAAAIRQQAELNARLLERLADEADRQPSNAGRAPASPVSPEPFAAAPDSLTVEQCAELAGPGVGPKTIYAAIHAGQLYGQKIGQGFKIPKRAFVAWLNGLENDNGQADWFRLAVVRGDRGPGRRPPRA